MAAGARRWTLRSIRNQMKKFRDPRAYAGKERKILGLDIEASVGVGSIVFNARVAGNSVPFHSVRVQFYSVEFREDDPGNYALWVPVKSGSKTVFFKVPHVNENPVKLYSTSQSYRFEFQKQNYDRRANIGNWKRYQRKTPPPVRPARPKNPNKYGNDFKNPGNHPGYDITIHSVIAYLIRKNLIRQ